LAPEIVFQTAQNAVNLWATAIVPAMLPFFILNNVLFAAGGVHLLGHVLRKPVQKALGLPGEAAFVLATGYSTGVPVSAALVAKLRAENRLTKKQGNRLLAFSANVSPAFILSAVAVAMLGCKEAGPLLAGVHYGTNIVLTLLCSLFCREPEPISPKPNPREIRGLSVDILVDAVFQSLRTIFLIGGIIVTFFICLAFFEATGVFPFLGKILSLSPEQTSLIQTFFRGFAEVTAGSQSTAALTADFPLKLAVLSGLLAFGGLSAACQIASQIQKTDLSIGFYLGYKIIQGAMAFAVSLLLPLKTAGAWVPLDFAHSTPIVLPVTPNTLVYAMTVIFSAVLIFRYLFRAEGSKPFYWYSGGFRHDFFSRCKGLYRDYFQSDKERR